MYNRTYWQNHVTEFENRYTEVVNDDGTVSHDPVEGEILQQGTPQDEKNFNNIEEGIVALYGTALQLVSSVRHHSQYIGNLNGETGQVVLKNTEKYPFNNSQKTVTLKQVRETTNYTVSVDCGATDNVGDVVITDKMVNGFKIRYTGSAAQVTVNYTVRGGLL